jgi:hypothetical protein
VHKSVAKIIGREDVRRSRVHSRSGVRVPVGLLPGLCVAVARRLRGVAPDGPWIAPEAVRFLDSALRSDDAMVEFGGGASSRWFAERVGKLTTIEADPDWFASICVQLAPYGHAVAVGESCSAFVASTPVPSPTVVVVDQDAPPADMTRTEVVEWASRLEPRPELIVVDDSDRADLRGLEDLLGEAYEARRFLGFKPFPLQLIETTVFRRRRASTAPRS